MQRGFLRSAFILALLSCIGPISIDMYLPAMPALAEGLGGSVTAMQMTITSFFIAFGLAQIVYGPLADQYGRKAPLYVGMALFITGSLICLFASGVPVFIAGRVIQGLGAAAIMVIPRAIIRDQHTGTDATRLMAMVMLVVSVSPMLAPLAGSGLIALGGWRLIFVVMAAAGVLSIVVTALFQPETLAREHRVPVDFAHLWSGTRTLVADPVFMGATFVGGFGFASFLVFIASAAFVYTDYYGLTPTGFSIAFALGALGFFGASQFAGPIGEKMGMTRMVSRAVVGFLLATLLLAALVAAGFDQIWLLIGMLFIANAFLGLVIPTSMVMALDDHGEIAGLASSLGGTMQMVAAGILTAILSPFVNGTPLPLVAGIAICGVLAFITLRLTARASRKTIPLV